MTEHKSFRSLISERQHEAEAALVRGDVGPRLRMWPHNDPVALFAAVGPSKTGWDELEPTFRSVAARLSDGRDVTYEIMAFEGASRLAFLKSLADARGTRVSRSEILAACPTLLVAGELETAVRRSNAALAAVMPRAVARNVAGLGHGWLGTRMELHLDMVEAWLTTE